jgi:hypothetical protein
MELFVAVGSAVITIRSWHEVTTSVPAFAICAIGSSDVPSKHRIALQSLSLRWYAISRGRSNTFKGTTTAPAFRIPKYAIGKYGRFGHISAT